MTSSNKAPSILIVEDDPDQMALLIDFTRSEIKDALDDENINGEQKERIKNIRILKVNNVGSLQKAVSADIGIIFTVLDCNLPDTNGSHSHDQLLKTNHRITGQHRPLDIVIENLPNTPTIMISSLNRFQKLVSRYYKSTHNLSVNFISKSDQSLIRKSIRHNLRAYLSH